MSSRREFLIAGAGALAAGWAAGAAAWSGVPPRPAASPMRILVLGGTGFLGPHFVAAARARGHRLTLFNRGKSNPERFSGAAFQDIEQLHGDRKTDLSALGDARRWDAVLDTSAYLPADVSRSAGLLAGRTDQYLIVSTISVYADHTRPGGDETGVVGTLADPTVTEIDGETYGPLKALCEQAAEAALPGKVTVVRPGLIVGPGDTTDRFTYWPVRIARGGEVLAPDVPERPVQVIDARDLAAFMLHLLERRTYGVFDADGAPGALTMGSMLADCQEAARRAVSIQCVRAPCPQPAAAESTLTWVPADFLERHGVQAWQDLPVWMPPTGEFAAFGQRRIERARAAGLVYRPLVETATDTLRWWNALPEARRAAPKAGLGPEREAEVLLAWRQARAG